MARIDNHHSRLSPSGAVRWTVCHGAPNAEEGIVDGSSEWAREGTFFHKIGAQALEAGLEARHFVGIIRAIEGQVFEFTEEHERHLQDSLDFLREQRGEMFIETWVNLTKWLGYDKQKRQQGGSLDVGIYNEDLITIFDWKYGQGHPVHAEWNSQTMLYALGFWWNIARHHTKATKFRLIIWQPRVYGGGGTFECTLEELLEFGEEIKEHAKKTNDPHAIRTAGLEQCHFCKARTSKERCPAYDAFNLKMLSQGLRDLDGDEPPELPRLKGITPERRSYILKHRSMIVQWLREMHTAALHDALVGNPVPFLKAVEGRAGARKWTDEKRAARVLATRIEPDHLWERSLVSPAKAEKILGRKEFSGVWKDLTIQNKGKPILVPLEDKRDAVKRLDADLRDLDFEEDED